MSGTGSNCEPGSCTEAGTASQIRRSGKWRKSPAVVSCGSGLTSRDGKSSSRHSRDVFACRWSGFYRCNDERQPPSAPTVRFFFVPSANS